MVRKAEHPFLTHAKKQFWILTNKCGNNLNGLSASFSCLTLFLHLLVKIQNSFLCMHVLMKDVVLIRP